MLVRPQGLLCLIERADPIVVRFAARPVPNSRRAPFQPRRP